MEADCAGKVAVVTGGSRGIGRATAVHLAERGAEVVLLARREDRLREAAEAIGEQAHPIVADVSDPRSLRAAFDQIGDRFSHIDVLVNNAGLARIRSLEECSDEEVLLQVGVNLMGPIWCTRAAIPLLKRAGGSDIINVTSEAILDPYPLLTLYAASKAGLATFSEGMNRELLPHDIRVSLIVVGRTETEFGLDWSQEEAERGYAVWQSQGFLKEGWDETKMKAAEVADAIVYAVTRPRSQVLDVFRVRTRH